MKTRFKLIRVVKLHNTFIELILVTTLLLKSRLNEVRLARLIKLSISAFSIKLLAKIMVISYNPLVFPINWSGDISTNKLSVKYICKDTNSARFWI